MFERRLKLFLVLLSCICMLVLGRAAEVQIVRRGYWNHEAAVAMMVPHPVETTRGPIADRNGHVLAMDEPCIDACVDYRALTSPPDAVWLKQQALTRLETRYGDQWKNMPSKERAKLRDQEIATLEDDIEKMWPRLAAISGRSLDDIEETCRAIVQRIDMRQRYIWNKRYEEALRKQGTKVDTGSWKKWIADDGSDDKPPIDKYQVIVAEQIEPHVILPAVDLDVQNQICKEIDKFPGLVLRPGTHRTYPYGDVACHLLGNLGRVDKKELEEKNHEVDEPHRYQPNDLIGKTGIEALCEPALRGGRGEFDTVLGENTVLSTREPTNGGNVRISIDVELQQQIQSVFTSATLRNANGEVFEQNAVIHGAAVVLDVETNQVLALVSYPTYNLNQLEEQYAMLHDDEINEPLRNRATMSQLEPGLTMKPFCGLAGICQGVIGIHDGIECCGVLKIDGKLIPYGARCWVDSMFRGQLNGHTEHHPVPWRAPHRGIYGNKDGWLVYSDALERSCNSYFENVADRLGIGPLSMWYDKFGFGRPTGLGIAEVSGRLPSQMPDIPAWRRRIIGMLGGIGQGYVAATPIQMANGAAMIARNGIWMRPILVLPDKAGHIPAMRAGASQGLPDRIDLHLSPEALQAAHLGMYNVVNGPAGTGKPLVAGDKMLQELGICGKTGTAQASAFAIVARDAHGKPLRNEEGKIIWRKIEPSLPGKPNPEAPWYRAEVSEVKVQVSPGVEETKLKTSIDHSWYIGFAPADHPRIAFAVMVEYGGSGGGAAASVAREAIEACISRGYIAPPK